MKKIIVNVDWERNYNASVDEVAVVVAGKTLDEIRERMTFSLSEHIKAMREDGENIPAVLVGEYELEFHLSARAMLHYTEGLVSRKALAHVTGINQQQLTHYATGWRNPRPEMQKRIIVGIHKIGQELIAVR